MALSNGGRSLVSDIISWSFALCMLAVAVMFAPEIKSAAYAFLGKPDLARPDASQRTRIASVGATAPEGLSRGGRAVELSVGSNGHFFAAAEINGRRVDVMVDTGASIVALTYDDARAIGVTPSPSEFTHTVSTANGTARVAPVLLDRIQIGDIVVRRVQAAVIENGKLQTTLLGNSFLGRLSSYQMRSGRLILEE